MGIVEQYYAPLCCVYRVILDDLKGTTNKALILQMAVKAINNTAGPNRLVLTLLVFRSYLRLTNLDPSLLSIAQQAAAIKKATDKVSKLYAARQIKAALQQCNRPQTDSVHNLILGSEVLV